MDYSWQLNNPPHDRLVIASRYGCEPVLARFIDGQWIEDDFAATEHDDFPCWCEIPPVTQATAHYWRSPRRWAHAKRDQPHLIVDRFGRRRIAWLVNAHWKDEDGDTIQGDVVLWSPISPDPFVESA